MKNVVVVCPNPDYYRAYCLDVINLFGKDGLTMFNHKLQTSEARFIPVYVEYKESLDRIRGLNLEKVVIYNCSPNMHMMDILRAGFRDKRPYFEKIWN